ncbi:MAG: pyrroline-5-carboxylate reductase [Gammaproteobacteria bacterium]|nr:pyrroline-5-carboxylate reductase [Gammaproteobacteria bacterium]
MKQSVKVSFIGAGRMTTSIVQGLSGNKKWNITVSDRHPEKLARLKEKFDITICNDNLECVSDTDLVILSVQPAKAFSVIKDLSSILLKNNTVLVSILGGTTLEKLLADLEQSVPAVHCMPNVCSAVKEGVTSMYANELVSIAQKQLVEEFFGDLGYAFWLSDDNLTDSVAAISGSGPAYCFFMMKIMQGIAEKFGISNSVARHLVQHTFQGAANLAIVNDNSFDDLIKNVTTPKGSTEQAIKKLKENGVDQIFTEALTAALKHKH